LNKEAPSAKKKIVRWAKTVFGLLILALVAFGIWRAIQNADRELQQLGYGLSDVLARISPLWLVVAGLSYLVGLIPCWLFWHRTLLAMKQQPRWYESLRAFYIGHLGKYVPGKALVVVIRAGLIRSDRVNATVAATSVFVETLTMMAVGAFLAAALIGAMFRENIWLMVLALGLMVAAGGPTLPPIFRRLVRLAKVRVVNPEIDAALEGLDFRLMTYGWITVAAGWWLLGFSLWATLKGIPFDMFAETAEPLTLGHWPLLTACAALALVAGFLSLLPGGIGIREYVVTALLSAPFGPTMALMSAILLRLAWLGAELIFAGILYAMKPRGHQEAKDAGA
jgi:uncharacterized membrane protein YbhN (UPF0104 family)